MTPRTVHLIGLCCSSLCLLGLPVLGLWLSARGLGWLVNEWLTRTMLLLFLILYGVGMLRSFRHHKRRGSGVLAITSGSLLVGTAWHVLPPYAGWIALGGLIVSQMWDRRLLSRTGCH